MSFGDYGAVVWLNDKRRVDKEDTAIFEVMEQYSGEPEEGSIYHGVLGDGPVRVACFGLDQPRIYMMGNGSVITEIHCAKQPGSYDRSKIEFKYNGYFFLFGNEISPHYAAMITPSGDRWECYYGRCYKPHYEDFYELKPKEEDLAI